MRTATSSTSGLANGTTSSCRIHSATMQDFHLSLNVRWAHVLCWWCAVVLGL